MPRKYNRPPCFIGIDNGVSGSIGIIRESQVSQKKTPTFKEQNYTKKKDRVSRIDAVILHDLLQEAQPIRMVLLERPMVNPTRFKATTSALRALEATLVCLESLNIPYAYVDSKEWQSKLLPKGVTGSKELKEASKDIACRLFPSCKEDIEKQKDGDGLLIAEHCRREYGNG